MASGTKLWAHRKTDDPMLGAILLAKQINELCGGAVIAPGEVDELPDEWLDALADIGKWLG